VWAAYTPPVVLRTLSERELNRAILARQLLLDRAHLPLPRAVERIGGLQTQYAPSGYIGLWSRVEGFRRDRLTRALERRLVVQATLMRSTIHMVSRADHHPFAVGVRRARREWWLRATRHRETERTMAARAKTLRRMLAEGPLRRAEIMKRIGGDTTTWNGLGLWIDLVRVPPSGTWVQRRADLYAAAEDWLGPSEATPEEGTELLVRRYLAAFGPASRGDVASWSGLPLAALTPVIDRLALRHFVDERGGALLDVPRAPLPDPDTPAPVRFLPTWDATLLVHARRTQILPEQYRPLVFNTKTPHSVPAFLVDGRVAGSWRYENGNVRTKAFAPLAPAVRREVAEEAERLAAFMA
jgi:Winged helix DNA-binding domain